MAKLGMCDACLTCPEEEERTASWARTGSRHVSVVIFVCEKPTPTAEAPVKVQLHSHFSVSCEQGSTESPDKAQCAACCIPVRARPSPTRPVTMATT